MDDNKRLHRKDPTRSAPVRNFSGLFRSDPDANTKKSSSPNGATRPAGYAVSDEPVGLAYRVIEKHISEGKQNAGFFNDQPYQTRAMTDGFQDLLERTIRFQSEIIPLWIEALTSAVKVEPIWAPGAASSPTPGPESNDAPSQDSKAISVEVASVQPVQISIDLKDNSERLPLVTLGLRAVEQNTPVLGDITFVPATSENPIQLRISIDDSCPPGSYSGVVVNQVTGEVRGTLTVRVAR